MNPDTDISPLLPQGYYFCSTIAGFKSNNLQDLGFIGSDRPASGAGVFTQNRFQAAPVQIARELLSFDLKAQGIIVNSGQANACTGHKGLQDCRQTLLWAGEHFGISEKLILPASTGVIGQHLDLVKWQQALRKLKSGRDGQAALGVSKAMTTTDTFPKLIGREIRLKNGKFRMLGMAKGAGMICPQMATMLSFLVCDLDVEPGKWQKMLTQAVDKSFNRITIDGDTSTNDCVLALANGLSGVTADQDEELTLLGHITELCSDLAYLIVQDAEGGTKVVNIKVTGAKEEAQAETAARSIAHSPLVKTALFGQDPNWGRIIAALGRSGADFNPENVEVRIGHMPVLQKGHPVPGLMEDLLIPLLKKTDVSIEVDLGNGGGEFQLLTSDLSYDYVKINAGYRT